MSDGLNSWIGVDLDGTLARYDGWVGPDSIGEPVSLMADRLRAWVESGERVKIFTARVWSDPDGIAEEAIHKWLLKHFGFDLEVTCVKDYGMIELWDDRCVRVIENTGVRCCS